MIRVLRAIFATFLLVLISDIDAPAAHAQDMPTITVRTDWAPWGLHAGLHLANQKGWFKSAGLNVVVTDGTGSSSVLQQVATGSIDVGWVSQGTAAVARCKAGLPVVSIYQLGRKGDIGLLVPKGKYSSVVELKGRKIGFAAGGFTPFLEVFLQAAGAKGSDFDLVNLDAGALASAYASGQVDGVFAGVAYFLPTVANQRPAGSILMSDVGINSPGFGLVTTQKVIDAKSESLDKLVKVLTRSWDYIYESDDHVNEAVQAIKQQRASERLDDDILKGQIELYKDVRFTSRTQGKGTGWMDDDDWVDAYRLMEKVGLCPSGWNAHDIYTNRFFDKK